MDDSIFYHGEDQLGNESLNFTSTVNGPVYAVFVGIEIVLAVITNLFVLIFTVSHPKTLKQPSIIFLTNFVLVNLIMAFIYLPSVMITAIEMEWIIGQTVEEKMATCQLMAFIFTHTFTVQTFTLTVISVDRFLFIVKPFIHRRYVKTWIAVSVSVIIWIASCVLSVPPLLGFGKYVLGISNFACAPLFDEAGYIILGVIVIIICVTVITVTSTWTFCFTRKFINKTRRHASNNATTISSGNTNSKPSVYDSRMVKVIGIFGTMLLVTAITYVPVIIIAIASSIIGIDILPGEVFTIIAFLFYTITISNPIIQSYFRRDLKEFVMKYFVQKLICYFCGRSKKSASSAESTVNQLNACCATTQEPFQTISCTQLNNNSY